MTKEGNRVAATSSACRAIWIGLRAFDLRCVPPATGQDFRVFRETVTMNLVARFCRFLSNGQCGVSAAIQRSAQEVVGGLGGSAGNCALWATERKTLAIAHHVDLASGDVVQLVRTLPSRFFFSYPAYSKRLMDQSRNRTVTKFNFSFHPYI